MNYNETLLNAISTVVQGEMKHISFDKTILCTIVDDKFSSKRVYTVSDGTSKFTAYAETNTTYRKNEQVYVTIPQGDYREKKIIIGRQAEVKDANIPNDYILPLESVVDMTDNLVPPAERGKTSSILANGDIENKFIGKVDLKGSEQSDNFIYNILSVRADFKCNIEEQYKLISGMYALRLDVYVDESTSEEPEKIQVYTFQLQSSQMFGNIYHSSLFLPQEMKIDISKLKNITSIVMYICQDKEFIYGKDLGGNPLRVPTTQAIGNSVTLKDDNIFIKNINLAFGNDISKIPDNTLKIGTKDSLNYTKNNSSKMVYTSWYNKDADNRYIGFEDGIVDYDPAISEPSKQRWYDEKKYQKEFQEKYVGGTEWSEKIKLSQTSEQEEKKIKVPDVTEALQVYSLCLKQDDKYKEFRSVINSLKDTILDLQTTIGSFYAESGTEKVKPYFVGILQSIEQFKIVLNKIKGEPKDSNKVLSYYYIDYLNNYNDLFNQLVQEYDIITKGTSSTNRVSYPTAPLQNVNEIALNLKKLAKDNYNSSVDLPLEGSETGETYKSLTYAGKKLYEDLSKITGLTETGKQNLDSVLKRSKSSYDQYMRSIDKIFSELEKEIESPLSINMAALHDRFYIEKLPETEEEINALALVIKTFSEEYKEFVALNENRYCIYWYKYSQDQDAKDDIAGEHWVLVPNPAGTPSYEHPVPGMPSIVISNDRVYYSKDSTTPYQNFPLDLEKKATRLKAILFFNHEAFTSEELTFTNQDEDLNLSDADLNNTIHIELGENALEKYHMYGTNNEILNSSKAAEKRQLRVRYEDAGQKDEALIDTDVFWYVPDGDTTMLVYDATSLSQKGFRLITQSDSEYASYFEKGYACFYKRISFTEVEGKKELQVADTYFHFSIKSYYNAMATNNTIRCKIRKNNINFIAKQSFSFNSFGTNGTNYTLTVRPVSDQQALINESQEKVHNLEVEISLTDKDSNLIPAEDYNIKYFEPAKNEPHSAAIGSTGQGTKRIITGIMNDSSCLYNVYQCSVNYWSKQSDNGTTYDLSVYFPVPFSTGFYRFQGASTVIYDDYGRNPSYASYEYKLFDMTTNEEKVDNLWEIWYYNNEGIRITETSAIENIQRYLPTLRQKRDTNYYILDPKIIYVPAEKPKDEFYSVVVCLNQSDRKLLWAQPIKILQNRFNCPMLNNWDGELLIDKENNSILAATMAAGIKNSDNSFSGVLMGRVKKESSQERALTGLYGFNHGAQAYGFRENGTAFIGEAGKGRIEFDGQKGIIQSGTYNLNQGMSINLTEGTIDAHNFALTGGSAESSNFIGLYSHDQKKNSLVNGHSSNTWRIVAGKNFGVDKDGSLYASNANISGIINASSGTIGCVRIAPKDMTLNRGEYLEINGGESGKYENGNPIYYNTYIGKPNASLFNEYVIMSGSSTTTPTSYPFRVSKTGKLYASGVEISGNISITSGTTFEQLNALNTSVGDFSKQLGKINVFLYDDKGQFSLLSQDVNRISQVVGNSESGLVSQVEQQANQISNMVSNYKNGTGFGHRLTDDQWQLYTFIPGQSPIVEIPVFTANKDGIEVSGNAKFSGIVHASTGGNFGGWISTNNGEGNYSEQSLTNARPPIEGMVGSRACAIGLYSNYFGNEGYRLIIGEPQTGYENNLGLSLSDNPGDQEVPSSKVYKHIFYAIDKWGNVTVNRQSKVICVDNNPRSRALPFEITWGELLDSLKK